MEDQSQNQTQDQSQGQNKSAPFTDEQKTAIAEYINKEMQQKDAELAELRRFKVDIEEKFNNLLQKRQDEDLLLSGQPDYVQTIRKMHEDMKKDIDSRIQSRFDKIDQERARESFFKMFYQKNPDLERAKFLVEAVLNAELNLIKSERKENIVTYDELAHNVAKKIRDNFVSLGNQNQEQKGNQSTVSGFFESGSNKNQNTTNQGQSDDTESLSDMLLKLRG